MGEAGAERRHATQAAEAAREHAFAILSATIYGWDTLSLIEELDEDDARLVVRYLARSFSATLKTIAEKEGRDMTAWLPEMLARARRQ